VLTTDHLGSHVSNRPQLYTGKMVSHRGWFCACAICTGKDGSCKAPVYDIAEKRRENCIHVWAYLCGQINYLVW